MRQPHGAGTGAPLVADQRGQLAVLVRQWRQRLEGRRSQSWVAHQCEVSLNWYGHLERADPVNYSIGFLSRLAQVLGLDDLERGLLFELAAGLEPPLSGRSPARVEVSPARRVQLDSLSVPAWVSDTAWQVRYANAALRVWFPWLSPDGDGVNVMAWALTTGQARGVLVDWARAWAPLLITQLRAAVAARPDDAPLRAVAERVLTDPAAGQLWRDWGSGHARRPPERRLGLAFYGHRPVEVDLLVDAPVRSTGSRVVSVVPRAELDRQAVAAALAGSTR